MAKKRHRERRKDQRRKVNIPRPGKERRSGRERREATVEERSFLSDIREIRRRERANARRGGDSRLSRGPRKSGLGLERGARDGDRLRPALQAPLLHGDRDSRQRRRRGVPSARQ